MSRTKKPKEDPKGKRKEKLPSKKPKAIQEILPENLKALVHELEVHQEELKVKNEELRRGEDRFRTSVEKLPEGFAILSSVRNVHGQIVDLRFEYINEAGCKINQKSREEHIGKTSLELFPERKGMGLFEDCVRVIETGQPLLKEYVIDEPV